MSSRWNFWARPVSLRVPDRQLLIRIDIEVANLRQKIANGNATEPEQLQLQALLAQRALLLEEMTEQPRKDLPGL